MNLTDLYVKDVSSKVCDGHAVPSIVKETVATALVDGNNGLGAVVGNYSMELAMKKAKDVGIGWVAARSNNLILRFHHHHQQHQISLCATRIITVD